METQTIQIRGDNDAIAYINFVDRDLAVSIVYGDNQYDFTIEPITLKALAYAYKLHCEECDEKYNHSMKARIKETGVLIDVIPRININALYNGDNLYVCDNKVFRECELDFLNLGNSAIDWEKRRYELAKDYSTEFVKLQHKKGITECGILYPDVVSWSVELADALIKKLKGE